MADTGSKLTKVLNVFMTLAIVSFVTMLYAPSAYAIAGGWAPANLTNVSVGAEHSCAAANGKAYCWGRNDVGQLGNGTYTYAKVPTQVYMDGALAGKYVTMVSAGMDYSCAVASEEVYCWGYNEDGKFGTGNSQDSNVPVKTLNTSGALAGEVVTSVATGNFHTCATTESNKIACWGYGTNGQIGNRSTASVQNTPQNVYMGGALSGKVVQKVTAGDIHTCAVASGQAYCWGEGAGGRLGNNSTSDVNQPVAVTTSTGLSGKTVTDISASAWNYTCAVASGQAYCWGGNQEGQLGIGNTTNQLTPAAVNTSGALSGKTVTKISVGYSQTCAVLSNGAASCWGYNGGSAEDYGPLGNGTTASSLVPTTVDSSGEVGGTQFTSVDAGDWHTCGIAASRVFCWGANTWGGATTYGMLGANDEFSPALSPVQTRWSADIEQTAFRFYAPSTSSALPGAPYATTNTPVLLLVDDTPLRMRVGVQSLANQGVPVDFFANSLDMRLQYAEKTAGTCAAQTTGFADVTASTPISLLQYSGTTHGATSSFTADNPGGRPIQQMTFVSQPGPITNPTKIYAENMALWDFSLIDNDAPLNTRYCLRLNHAGSPLQSYPTMAEIRTAEPTALSLSFVNSSSSVVSNPSAALSPGLFQSACQTTTGNLLDQTSLRMRVTQTGAKGSWSLAVAPTDGPTALWERSDGQAFYDFNDSSGTPGGCGSGSDGDGYAGRLSVDLSGLQYQPQTQACVGGIFLGYAGSASFTESVNALTIVSVADTAGSNCYRDIYNVGMSQTIPSNQAPGQYSLDMTFTTVAQ